MHSLQVFNYLLLLNINFPPNVIVFSGHLSVALGNVPEFTKYIPDLTDYMINKDDVEETSDVEKLPQKFIDQQIGGYFLIAFGRTFTIWSMGLFVCLPFVYLFNKICKRVMIWDMMISAFFFNMPMRTITEQCIDLALQVIVNTKLIKFRNRS